MAAVLPEAEDHPFTEAELNAAAFADQNFVYLVEGTPADLFATAKKHRRVIERYFRTADSKAFFALWKKKEKAAPAAAKKIKKAK